MSKRKRIKHLEREVESLRQDHHALTVNFGEMISIIKRLTSLDERLISIEEKHLP